MDGSAELTGGELNAAVTREVIRIHMEVVGKGPRRAYSFHNENVLFTVLEGSMTPGERKLAANGDGEAVRQTKRLLHRAMEDDLRAAVGRLTRRRVLAVLSDLDLEPDLAVELFVLDSPLA